MKRILLTLPLVAALSLMAPRFAGAAEFVVNTTLDNDLVNAIDCTDVIPETLCSLRDAVSAANGNVGPDTIKMPAGTYKIAFVLGIQGDDLTIQKEGDGDVLIDGTDLNDRIFNVNVDKIDLTLKGISLKGNGLTDNIHSGCILFAGDDTSALSIEDGTIGSCKSSAGGAIDIAGSVGKRTNLNLKRVVFLDNEAIGGNGGAIRGTSTNVDFDSVSILSNIASAGGGGLSLQGGGNVKILNSTFSSNQAMNGGAIFLQSGSTGVTASIGFTTIADNKADGDSNVGGVFINQAPGAVTLDIKASIIYGNYLTNKANPKNCGTGLGGGVISSLGFNVYQNKMECNGGNNDQEGDPKLTLIDSPPGYYTIASKADGGLAEGAVPQVNCSFNNVNVSVDQLGNPRPLGTDCDAGAFELSICGDGIPSGDEQCDDGNNIDGDGCDATCKVEPMGVCGDNVVDPGEQCDDGNNVDGDGCSSNCQLENISNCGNNKIDQGEQCDDGNKVSGDGCSSTCQNEGPVNCGDGKLDADEQCDDGNLVNGDGCSSVCKSELNGGGGCSLGSSSSPALGAGLLALVAAMGLFAAQRRAKQS